MSYATKHEVTVTTDASGDGTAYTDTTVNGCVKTIIYTKDDFANGVDFTITTETTLQNLWVESDVNASATRAPHQPTHDATGTALVYAAAGEPVDTDIFAVDERLKVVVAQGGDTKSGTFTFIVT